MTDRPDSHPALTTIDRWLRKLDHAVHTSAHLSAPILLFYSISTVHNVALRILTICLALALLVYLILLSANSILETYHQGRRVKLQRIWQALAWTHYRGLLSELVTRASRKGQPSQFDFITFSSGRFRERLTSSGPPELQYNRQRSQAIDIVICDIEDVDDLVGGVTFEPASTPIYRPVNLTQVLTDLKTRSAIQAYLRGRDSPSLPENFLVPSEFAGVLQPQPMTKTLGIPLRWGHTGIAVNFTAETRSVLRQTCGIDFDTVKAFDLDWLLKDGPLRRWAQQHRTLVMIDWYLPVMLLLSWHLSGFNNFHELQRAAFDEVDHNLRSLRDLMHPEHPLIEDPLSLVKCVESTRDLIVVGGGNWLEPAQGKGDTNLIVLPLTHGYLLWCECLLFLASEQADAEKEAWQQDANVIARWLVERYTEYSQSFAFPAYQPPDMVDLRRRGVQTGTAASPRKLPPIAHEKYVCRSDWERVWRRWRSEVSSS